MSPVSITFDGHKVLTWIREKIGSKEKTKITRRKSPFSIDIRRIKRDINQAPVGRAVKPPQKIN